MPTFQKCPKAMNALAADIIQAFTSHQPLADAGVIIDFAFAYSDKDEKTGLPLNNALNKNGIRALGICRKLPLKDRAMGRGDAEISLDADWWEEASEEERRALLDHELHHIEVKTDDRGVVTDGLHRPVLRLRKHDVEVGWFKIVANRHGVHSQERQQARKIMADCGQYFWPDLIGKSTEHADTHERVAQKIRTPSPVPA